VVVVGQIARDLALLVDEVPEARSVAPVRQRREMLGGKGANQAVALARLGVPPALLGVVGDDHLGADLLERAGRDGIDVGLVVRRPGARTGLIVDVVDAGGTWRYLQDLPPDVLLTRADVDAAAPVLRAAGVVVLQLQQPVEAICAGADHARGTVVLDGAPPDPSVRRELLARADVLRADDREAALWTDAEVRSAGDALRVARELVDAGPRLVVLGAGAAGNAVAWRDGAAVVPRLDAEPVDTTGGGDAFIAGLVAGLEHGPVEAARWGSAAAACTIETLGGRPEISPAMLRARLARRRAAGHEPEP
jgi:ribokinase